MTKKFITHIFLILTISACSTQHGRYQQQNDSTPVRPPTPVELRDPIPRLEPASRGGNKDYQVRGINYQVLNSAENFEQTGIASWYGRKFHGHLTSNGEIYNMYSMSAAHKNLPLPTYLNVTNLENNKSVIVRVNDRGPFHHNRVIDLSYVAAYKLDMLKTGTTKVKITVIDYKPKTAVNPLPAKDVLLTNNQKPKKLISNNSIPKTSRNFGDFIQVFATRNASLAKSKADALAALYQEKVIWPQNDGIYRIQIGPINQQEKLNAMLSTLKQAGYPNAYKRKLLH